jgi:dihydrofolate reductase
MRRLVDYMFTSLDGLIADAEGELSWVPEDGELTGFANEYFASCDGIVFGRKNYQAFVEYWDGMNRNDPSNPPYEVDFARVFADMNRIVVTTTLEEVDDPRATLIKDDVPRAIEDVKQQPGRDLLLISGPDLRSTLARAGLVDLHRILVVPVVLGQGVPLFGELEGHLRLRLTGIPRVFEDQVVMLDYVPEAASPE